MATKVTAADILKKREEERKACRLAHSANANGEFFARVGCSCYTCRDVLDPTGEEDAAEANRSSTPETSMPPPQTTTDSTHREDAIHSLKMLIEELKEKQDAVYDGEPRSHDEMAAQDMEWEEYDRKIMSAEQCLIILENFA